MNRARSDSWLYRNGWWVVLVIWVIGSFWSTVREAWPSRWLSLEQRWLAARQAHSTLEQVIPKAGQLCGPYPGGEALTLYTPDGKHSVATRLLPDGREVWLTDGKLQGPLEGHEYGQGDLDTQGPYLKWGQLWRGSLWVGATNVWLDGQLLHNYYIPELKRGQPASPYVASPDGQRALCQVPLSGAYCVLNYQDEHTPLLDTFQVWACWDRARNRPLARYQVGRKAYYLWDGTTTQGPFVELSGPTASLTGTPRLVYMVREREDGPVWLVDQGRKVQRFDEIGEPTLSDDGKHLALVFESKDSAKVWFDGKWLGPFHGVSSVGERPGSGHLGFFAYKKDKKPNEFYVDGQLIGQGSVASGPFVYNPFLSTGQPAWVENHEQGGQEWVRAGDRRYGPYEDVRWLGEVGKTGQVCYWAIPAGQAQDTPPSFCLDGRVILKGSPASGLNSLGTLEELTNYKPVRGAEGVLNLTPGWIITTPKGQQVLVDGKPVGLFGWVNFVREESHSGPLTICYAHESATLRHQREEGRPPAMPGHLRPEGGDPTNVWVDGQTYSLRQYKRLAKAGGFPTSLNEAGERIGYFWLAGQRYGPFDQVQDYAISPDGKQLLLAFSYRGQAYLWQGPVPQ